MATIVFIFPVFGGVHLDYATRFVSSYLQCPPGYDHRLMVVSNGGPPSNVMRAIFAPIGKTIRWFEHDNSGFDIGGYQAAAASVDDDIMVCFGQSVYFHRAGWLKRMVDAWLQHGHGMYSGTASHASGPHLQTTGFWCPPWLILEHPIKVQTQPERYDFEHGPNAIWRRAYNKGLPTLLVTWDGEWELGRWRLPKNIIWRGDQSNCLYWTNHSDVYRNCPWRRSELAGYADVPG